MTAITAMEKKDNTLEKKEIGNSCKENNFNGVLKGCEEKHLSDKKFLGVTNTYCHLEDDDDKTSKVCCNNYFVNCSNCLTSTNDYIPKDIMNNSQKDFYWDEDGKLTLHCKQPIIPVPVIQEIQKRDKIIEIPHIDVVDAFLPKIYKQGVNHDVPKMQLNLIPKDIEIPKITCLDKKIVVPVVAGYTHKFVPKWQIRQVPRPIVKYVGEQEIIEVPVPQVKIVDKLHEHEVVVGTVKEKVVKIKEIPQYVDTIKYVWKPVKKIIEVERFVPKFDVALDCPAPLIVPFPIKRVKEVEPIFLRKLPHGMEVQNLDLDSRKDSAIISKCYIEKYFRKIAKKFRSTCICCGLPWDECVEEKLE